MEKTCPQCAASFEIAPEDLALYDAVSPVIGGKKYAVPSPTRCPNCRYLQRLTWRNERKLYHRTCDATGKDIVSIFSPEKTWPPVYAQEYWWSDRWDPKKYGRDIDWKKPFFEQYAELYRVVPQIALNNQQSENSLYTNQAQYNKDCYMIIASTRNRDCYFGMWFEQSENCMDCLYIERCQLCYELLNAQNCYQCIFSENLQNCSNVHFSRDCIGCSNCFGCVNLRNKQYHFLGTPQTKEDYASLLQAYGLQTYTGRQRASDELIRVSLHAPHKYYCGHTTENASGDYLQEVKQTHNSYNCRHTEVIRHCQDAWEARYCGDMTETIINDFCLSLEGCGRAMHSLFSMKLWDTHASIYCSHCMASKHLFGCVGMKHDEYCILNRQYRKEEYETLIPRLIEHMRTTGEWGEHFPSSASPFGYNETVAQEYFPLGEEESALRGFAWREETDDIGTVEKTISAAKLPNSIDDIPDDILNWAIVCEKTDRPFKIIAQELAFYRTMHLPVPRLHPDERHRRRKALRNPRKLWTRTCDKCREEIQSTYDPSRPEIVYCERCYLETVY